MSIVELDLLNLNQIAEPQPNLMAAQTTSPSKDDTRSELGFWESYLLSGAITTASRTLVAPLERIKILMQCEGELVRQGKIILTSNATAVTSELNAAAKVAAYSAANGGGREAAAAAASARMALKNQKNNVSYYTSMVDCARKTIQNDVSGVRSLWRGNLSTVLRYFPAQGLNFAFRGTFSSMQPDRKKTPFYLWFCGNTLSGGLSGTITLAVVYSLEYARTRMAVDIKSNAPRKNNSKPLAVASHQFSGLRDCLAQTVRHDGFMGLYRGFWITVLATFVKQGLYFGIFDSFRPLLPPASSKASSSNAMIRKLQSEEQSKTKLGRFYAMMPPAAVASAVFMLGWLSTFAANLISHPFDTVRRRYICGTCGPEQYKYKGAVDCFFKITKAEGYRCLWRGVGPAVVYSIAGGLALAAFDLVRPSYLSLRGVQPNIAGEKGEK